MSEQPVPHVLAAESRSTLLAALRAEGGPLSVVDAAAVLGLHPSTARFHLDLLVSAGLVDREIERRGTAGRPRIRYVARRLSGGTSRDDAGDARGARAPGPNDAPASTRLGQGQGDEADYERLARVLSAQLSGLDDPASAAREAGRRWVDALEVTPAAPGSLDAEGTTAAVAAVMERLGFAPDTPGPDRIVLRRCPFEAVALDHRAVVCGVHAGMLEHTFERLGGEVQFGGLEPFAGQDPLACVVHLARAEDRETDDAPGVR